MIKYLSILTLICCFPCHKKSLVEEHVSIEISVYEDGGVKKASAMPVINAQSELNRYKRRFDYLLINVSEMHQPKAAKERTEIWQLYPDTLKLQRLYLDKFIHDKKLAAYFEEAYAPIADPNRVITKTYTQGELMEVASKFFYCDQVFPDTTVQSHVCVGLNGVEELSRKKDYTLLAAFCFEAIFHDFDNDFSPIDEVYSIEKKNACEQFRKNITTLDDYLEHVRLGLFSRMENNAILKQQLLAYYKLNARNLSFKIVE